MQETVILTLATMLASVATLLAVMLWRAFARAPASARLMHIVASRLNPGSERC